MRMPEITRQAEDEAGGPVEEESRSKIADRLWVNDQGVEVEPHEATGVKYQFLGRTKKGIVVPPDGKAFTVFFRDLNDSAKNMLCGFGAHTLMGNVTNTWLGEKGEKAATAADAIAERIELLQSGQWVDRSGAVGARVNLEALTTAYCEWAASKGQTKDPSEIRQKLEDKPELVKAARTIPEVVAAYTRIVGRQQVDPTQLMADL